MSNGASWSHWHDTDTVLFLSCNLLASHLLALALGCGPPDDFFFFLHCNSKEIGHEIKNSTIQSNLLRHALKIITKGTVCKHELQLLVTSCGHHNPPPQKEKQTCPKLSIIGSNFGEAKNYWLSTWTITGLLQVVRHIFRLFRTSRITLFGTLMHKQKVPSNTFIFSCETLSELCNAVCFFQIVSSIGMASRSPRPTDTHHWKGWACCNTLKYQVASWLLWWVSNWLL